MALQPLLSHLALLLALLLLLPPPLQQPGPPTGSGPSSRRRWRAPRPPAYLSLGACELPADPLAPPRTASATPSAPPSHAPLPTGSYEALFAAARERRLEAATSQCGRVYSRALSNASARLVHLDSLASCLERGVRANSSSSGEEDAPLALPCPVPWLAPEEACRLLAALNTQLVLVGDSLVRQLQQGLFVALTGNYYSGGVIAQDAAEAARCACEAGLSWGCRHAAFPAAGWVVPPHLVCPAWGARRLLLPQYLQNRADDCLSDCPGGSEGERWAALDALLDGGTRLHNTTEFTLVVNVGLHDLLDAPLAAKLVYGPVLARAAAHPGTRILCMLATFPEEAKKPRQFMLSQGLAAVRAFNAELSQFCRDRGAEIFDAYSATVNASTTDGIHFRLGTNVLLAQLLLNTLAQGKGWERASAALQGYL
jgi:hypothetical protein